MDFYYPHYPSKTKVVYLFRQWNNWEEKYSRTVPLEKIKKESKSLQFSTRKI